MIEHAGFQIDLVYLVMCILRFIHVFCGFIVHFFLPLGNIPLYVWVYCSVFIHSPIGGSLYFQFLAVRNYSLLCLLEVEILISFESWFICHFIEFKPIKQSKPTPYAQNISFWVLQYKVNCFLVMSIRRLQCS